jgi:hypothetical protein
MQWFAVIGKELHDPAIVPENVYNMDETGVLLSVLSSLKVLVSKQDLTNCRGAGVRRTLVTAVECSGLAWPDRTRSILDDLCSLLLLHNSQSLCELYIERGLCRSHSSGGSSSGKPPASPKTLFRSTSLRQ